MRTLISGLGLFTIAFFPAVAFGQENQFQFDPIEHYTTRALLTVLIIGIAVVLYSILKYRGKTAGPASIALLLGGVALIPAVSSMVGTVLIFDKAEKVDFCASCHLTMQEYVDDLKSPTNDSLAAIHYKNRYIPDNQCYQCHTSYGIHGTVEAKMSGMIDTYKYYTRTFVKPIKMRTPYKNDDCLKCHSESVKWKETHDDFKAAIFSGDSKCMDCHADQHPAHRVNQKVAQNESH